MYKTNYEALKFLKMACSLLVGNLKIIEVHYFPFLNLLQGRYLIIKKYSFYFMLLSQSVLKLYEF